MEVGSKQIFNLWNTNGRRSDVLNALNIYLNILKEMKEDGSFDQWASFPESLTQFSFYQKAIFNSPEVFKEHPIYDNFINNIELDTKNLFEKNKILMILSNNKQLQSDLDSAIEARARHYSSNLVKFGFANDDRTITPAGQSYLNGKIVRDPLEKFLPLNDINIILLRQLMKLRIYTKNNNGERQFYSPFFNALNLLLSNETIDKNNFIYIVQGSNPYCDKSLFSQLLINKEYDLLVNEIISPETQIPIQFLMAQKIQQNHFDEVIKNRKSGKSIPLYYSFYSALFDYLENKNETTYNFLKDIFKESKEKIKKAFCLGKSIFDFGTNFTYSFSTFCEKNKNNPFICSKNFNQFFFKMYEMSKYADGISEYSDTTVRVLSACGLFKFKNIPELSNKKLLSIIFSKTNLIDNIFGVSDENEFSLYEKNDNSFFGSNKSICEILNLTQQDINNIYTSLSEEYGTTDDMLIKKEIDCKTSNDFKNYIHEKYPKERVIELLKLFSDRKNDGKIKKEVNESATVPTIYEYIVGIAWYYISNNDFDLYHSLNMTLNADFEPEMHAGGGVGDVVINYDNLCIMLEVTLMNKAAQKRSEWEPVLRHSLNNKALNMNKDVFTFFVADELDYNTINIWRAVAAAPLRSTSGDEKDVDGVVIMPFTNSNLIKFLCNDVDSNAIIKIVKESYLKVPKITQNNWHQEIIDQL